MSGFGGFGGHTPAPATRNGGSNGGVHGGKKKLALGGDAWNFKSLASELLALSAHDNQQRARGYRNDAHLSSSSAGPASSSSIASLSRAGSSASLGLSYHTSSDNKNNDRLAMLNDAVSAVEIDDWETPSPTGSPHKDTNTSISSTSSRIGVSNHRDGVTFTAPTGISDDDNDSDNDDSRTESKTKRRDDGSVVIPGSGHSNGNDSVDAQRLVNYDSDSDTENTTTRMQMPTDGSPVKALLDLSQASIRFVRPSAPSSSTASSSILSPAPAPKSSSSSSSSRILASPAATLSSLSSSGGLFAGANYPSIRTSSSTSGSGHNRNNSNLTSSRILSATDVNSSNTREALRRLANNDDLYRFSSSSSVFPSLAEAKQEDEAVREEVTRRQMDTFVRKSNQHEREIEDLETRYRARALTRITPRLNAFNQMIQQIGDEVEQSEKQRTVRTNGHYKEARAVLSEHMLEDRQDLADLIAEEDKKITALLALQKSQVVAAQAEEAIRVAAELKRRADEKAERERQAKAEAERKKKQEEEKKAADEALLRARALEEKKQKEEAERKAAAAVAVAAAPAKVAAAAAAQPGAPVAAAGAAPGATGLGSNTVAYAEYQRRAAKLAALRAQAREFEANPAQALQAKKTINLQINSLSATQEQVKNKTVALKNVLGHLRGNPSAFAFGLVLMAEKILDIAIVRAPSLSFAFSYLAYELTQVVPEFLDIFVGYINERCVFSIPYYPEKKAGQTVVDQQRAWGYVVSDAGAVEAEGSFLGRMKNIMNVYSAFMQWPFKEHGHGLSAAWLWVSRILNVDPRSATATCLLSFLEIAGFNFLQFYPQQAPKIFHLIRTVYVHKLPIQNEERKAAKHRVALWLHEYEQKGGKLGIPEGMQLPNNQSSDTRIVHNHNDDRAT